MKQSTCLARGILFCFLAACPAVSGFGQQGTPRPAVPLEPITAILDAFRSHSVVALGEGNHGNEQGYAFRLSLIRDPRFAATVNDIVVECGNARYQDAMDRYVRGEDVPDAVLRQAWQNTVGSPGTTCDLPIYSQFIRAVRAVNGSRAPQRQLRVLLGDPPVDWNSVHSYEDIVKWAMLRDSHPADLIRKEVLAKGRRALVVYGDMHLRRKQAGADYMMEDPITKMRFDGRTIVDQIESAPATAVFSIWTETKGDLTILQADVESWPNPSLAMVRGTVLGVKDFTFYYPGPAMRDLARPIEDKFDAILYLGPPSSITSARLQPEVCADTAYIEIKVQRMALVKMPQSELDRLKEYCAAQAQK